MKSGSHDFEAVKHILDGVALASLAARQGTSYADALQIYPDYVPQIALVYSAFNN